MSNAITKAEAVEKGFAGFNNYPHIPVVLPPGDVTLTIRTHGGDLLTLSFIAYDSTGDVHRCVDIVHHNAGASVRNGSRDVPAFNVAVRSTGSLVYAGGANASEKPPTFVSIGLQGNH